MPGHIGKTGREINQHAIAIDLPNPVGRGFRHIAKTGFAVGQLMLTADQLLKTLIAQARIEHRLAGNVTRDKTDD